VIESIFTTNRRHAKRVNGAFSRMPLLSMLFKPAAGAGRSVQRLNGFNQLAEVIRGVRFVDELHEDPQLAAEQRSSYTRIDNSLIRNY
jgi:hypothetical protein